jgi:hypothetical protein
VNARRSGKRSRRASALALAGAIAASAAPVLTPRRARAYNYESALATGCHEPITMAALRELRADGDTLAPWPATGDDRLWIDDLPFDLPSDARDLAGASLLVGVRDNDLKGRSGLDTTELARVHGDPAAQMEHCLRRPEHDEPDGSAAALAECRAFIRGRVRDALREGLDARGRPDAQARVVVPVYLAFAGEQRVPMPRFYVQLGRALHALQDSFSHALRSEDGLRVRALLNWVDFADEHHDQARDGPVHRSALDRCEDLDALRTQRLALATRASTELLAAAADETRSPAARMAAVDEVLDRYLSFEPGCGADDAFCDAPELAYPAGDMACAASPGRARARWPSLTLLLCALIILRRSRLRPRPSPLVTALLLALAAPRALAHAPASSPAPAPASSPAHAPAPAGAIAPAPRPPPVPAPSLAHPARPRLRPRSRRPSPPAFALAASFGAAIDQPSLAAALGGRYRLTERWLLGLNVEWNPWASLEVGRVRSGTFNAYGTGVFRAPLTADVALRLSGELGAALLLFDVYGAPSGSVGPYVGISLLALELALGPDLVLVLEPAHVVVTAPHVTGIPLTRRQYRAAVTLELWL